MRPARRCGLCVPTGHGALLHRRCIVFGRSDGKSARNNGSLRLQFRRRMVTQRRPPRYMTVTFAVSVYVLDTGIRNYCLK